ncbi:ABC transporter ATP-binding protein [Schlesneria paludicola]|uniref:ABC transporter ATP-binding protein n=1 Tax=Schlesneria paludicola TaxID=360056 RepID=UPI00029AF4B8|nr:ABC transporter ATP-binding protein [Schlesneria paludicola]
MESLARLGPFIYQQRRALIVSVFLSVGAAVFAVAQLSLVYPTVRLLLEGKDAAQHVRDELQNTQSKIEAEADKRSRISDQLKDPDWVAANSNEDVQNLQRELKRVQGIETGLQRQEAIYQWFETILIPYIPTDRFNFLGFLLGLLLVLTLLKETCSFFQEMFVGQVVQRVLQSLRVRLYRSSLKLDQQTLALETTPRLMSRFTFDLHQVAHGLLLLGSKIIVEPMKAIIFIGCAFMANWRLTLLAFVCAPIFALFFGRLGKKLKHAAKRQMESMSRVYHVLEEALSSLKTVQSYRNERLHRRRLALEHRTYYEKAMRILRIDVMVSPSVEFLAMCGVFIASLPGAYLVLRHQKSIWGVQLAAEQMTVSDLAFLYTCLAGVLDPGRKLSGVYSKLKKSATACGRLFAWMDRASLVKLSPTPVALPRHRQSIEFDQVTFYYSSLESEELGRKALDAATVSIPFGSTVAVVGSNGCGKSTLINLLPRFFDPHSGQVRIDGTNVSDVDPRQLRRQIGFVTQETLLFDWSISDNIRYGNPNATDAEIEEAARKAYVIDFVNQLPDRFETQIGDKGHRLSGGQRQRVALARAILRDPAILILDEATSAIDTQSEQCIHHTLREFAPNRTTFIVTHAMTPTLLECVTHVLVMDEGRVISFGAHDAVLATCPEYQKLFEAQTLKRAG